jgi:hypothetical protein
MEGSNATSGDGAAAAAGAETTADAGFSVQAPDAWHVVGAAGEPKFIGSWRNYDGMFGNTPYFNSAAFFKDAAGVVHLRGMVEYGTSPDIFKLPAGFYPPRFHRYPAVLATRIMVCVEVDPMGTVSRVALAGGHAEGTSLEGISFRAF